METARRLLREKKDLLLTESLSKEDRFHITYATYKELFNERDKALSKGRDVVINHAKDIHPYFIGLPQDIKKYLIRLKVSPETLVKRLEARGSQGGDT
ncbi:MAG: hypothetical protein HY831_02845 [Candidatus Aenigmarchaeota archaeon]|nr:hypothetical protein [Candidatus Aenigmarchaeota archaeon]